MTWVCRETAYVVNLLQKATASTQAKCRNAAVILRRRSANLVRRSLERPRCLSSANKVDLPPPEQSQIFFNGITTTFEFAHFCIAPNNGHVRPRGKTLRLSSAAKLFASSQIASSFWKNRRWAGRDCACPVPTVDGRRVEGFLPLMTKSVDPPADRRTPGRSRILLP